MESGVRFVVGWWWEKGSMSDLPFCCSTAGRAEDIELVDDIIDGIGGESGDYDAGAVGDEALQYWTIISQKGLEERLCWPYW